MKRSKGWTQPTRRERRILTKRTVALFLAILLTLAMCFTSNAAELDETPTRLSELSEEECIQFIQSKGLEIPEELKDYQSLGAFIKNVIAKIEENPYHQFIINYYATYEFANQIKYVVNEHYGVSADEARRTIIGTRSYSLQFSTVYGNWLDEYYGYNCYAYALGQTRPFDGYVIKYEPGDFNIETCSAFSLNMSVDEMAELTMSDMESLGYACRINTISYSEIMTYSDTHSIICLRKCSTPGLEDFHYMKLSGSVWRHKPGLTQVLQLNTLPGETIWFNEGVINGVPSAGDRYYTGTIHYFAFRTDHNLTTTGRTGNDYHSGMMHYLEYRSVCADCGAVVYHWEAVECAGPPCVIEGLSLRQEELVS